ncbi:hypothetical protein DIURU_003338 [Diutina rugosa]|uniref:Ubiquitin-like protease family profile domain-containing protein n=1 Tax=Diutina rugosa TaxID=5481 RepID=A0A642UKT6_DIURU|nr:uncharacterized protein DIURU_003338 [Diutina rugosa]KAA8900968.1 hypothetical protein DIURU_003338 [Diutina rugosa]
MSLKDKKFSSIQPPRRSFTNGGVVPRNNLTSPTKITPEDPRKSKDVPIDELNHKESSALFAKSQALNRQVEASNRDVQIREQFKKEKPIKSRVHNGIATKAKSSSKRANRNAKEQALPAIHDMSGLEVDRSAIESLYAYEMKSLQYKGQMIKSTFIKHWFVISKTAPILYFATMDRAISPYIFHRERDVAQILFGENEVIIVLKDREEEDKYVLLTHNSNDTHMREAFKNSSTWASVADTENIVLKDTIDYLKAQCSNERKMTSDHPTRRSARLVILDEVNRSDFVLKKQARQKPATFKPPLSYSFQANDPVSIDVGEDPEKRGKNICVTQQDFNTLYNNEWVNDIIIDFFVSYEIAEAQRQGKLGGGSIYSFNSYFYTKLIQKPDGGGSAPFYNNVKRWLKRMDKEFMTYDSIVIPINESSHWYVCVVRGLPSLLARAKGVALQESNERSSFETPSESPLNVGKAEVFVLDSLNQRHSTISIPLKRLIIDYCEDVHNVTVQKSWIYMKNASVPKQSNFNDCGIHVIFNIRAWLNKTDDVESYWRSGKRGEVAKIFGYEEQKNMRGQLVDALLKLHRAEYGEQHEVDGDEVEQNGADSDIEEIVVEVARTPIISVDGEQSSEPTDSIDANEGSNAVAASPELSGNVTPANENCGQQEETTSLTNKRTTDEDVSTSTEPHQIVKASVQTPISSQTYPSDPIEPPTDDPKSVQIEESDVRFTSQESIEIDPIDCSPTTQSQSRQRETISIQHVVDVDHESSPEPPEVVRDSAMVEGLSTNPRKRRVSASPKDDDVITVAEESANSLNVVQHSQTKTASQSSTSALDRAEISSTPDDVAKVDKPIETRSSGIEETPNRKDSHRASPEGLPRRNQIDSLGASNKFPQTSSIVTQRLRPRHQTCIIVDDDDDDVDINTESDVDTHSVSDINTSVTQLALSHKTADDDEVVEVEEPRKRQRRT